MKAPGPFFPFRQKIANQKPLDKINKFSITSRKCINGQRSQLVAQLRLFSLNDCSPALLSISTQKNGHTVEVKTLEKTDYIRRLRMKDDLIFFITEINISQQI
jgi:hypothetical protein